MGGYGSGGYTLSIGFKGSQQENHYLVLPPHYTLFGGFTVNQEENNHFEVPCFE